MSPMITYVSDVYGLSNLHGRKTKKTIDHFPHIEYANNANCLTVMRYRFPQNDLKNASKEAEWKASYQLQHRHLPIVSNQPKKVLLLNSKKLEFALIRKQSIQSTTR